MKAIPLYERYSCQFMPLYICADLTEAQIADKLFIFELIILLSIFICKIFYV